MKNLFIVFILVVVLGVGAYFLMQSGPENPEVVNTPNGGQPPVGSNGLPEGSTTGEPQVKKILNGEELVLGNSVEGREIVAYRYGGGSTKLLFVGGIHGGYSWNTALVAYELMDYLKANPGDIPENVMVTVIPVLNPDGLFKVTGTDGRFTKTDVSTSQSVRVSGRFNANKVDLNRNFDCKWQSSGVWQQTTVSGGGKVFSEPESSAFRKYVLENNPDAVVVWYSAAGGVYASNCENGILPETTNIMNVYAKASGYPAFDKFDFYELTGDMVNWLASRDTTAISVLLSNHTDTEWTKNLAGIKATLEYFTK